MALDSKTLKHDYLDISFGENEIDKSDTYLGIALIHRKDILSQGLECSINNIHAVGEFDVCLCRFSLPSSVTVLSELSFEFPSAVVE